MVLNPRFNDPDSPLVSLIVLNHNQGQHLGECFDSLLAQSYDNIEICFSDNCSSDDSWDVAQTYQQRHPNIIFLARQRQAFPDDVKYATVWSNVRGHYFVEISSGDATLHPEFIRTCIDALQANPDAGFVMVNSCSLDALGQVIDDVPYFDRSCKIPGVALAAEFMSSPVITSTAQAMYRRAAVVNKSILMGRQTSHYNGARYLNFQLCIEGPALFIKKSLVTRLPHFQASLHSEPDTLLSVFGHYLINVCFFDIAKTHGLSELTERFAPLVVDIATQMLQLAVRQQLQDDEREARRFAFQAAAVYPEITDNALFRQLSQYWTSNPEGRAQLRPALAALDASLVAKNSRTPPPGSETLLRTLG